MIMSWLAVVVTFAITAGIGAGIFALLHLNVFGNLTDGDWW